MEILTDPNVAYVLLILGFLTAVLALFSPGTGILEIGALFALAIAGYGIANNPINWWAFIIMGVGLLPFILSLRQQRNLRAVMLIIASITFVLGSTLLFRGEGWRPAINIVLILLLSPLAIGGTWLIATKSLEAITSRPAFDLTRLTSMTGEVTSDIRGQGTVYVNGEEWTATSSSFIPAGTQVRVLGRKGLELEVEPVDK
jgi:membrane-bound serine protease (ClpP class)